MWLVPPLRFPEFTKEWKKKALGDIGEAIIGLTYSPFDVVPSDGTIVFRSSNIQDGQIDYSDLVRVSKNIKEKIITLENDILVCARNGSARLIGKNAILKQSDAGNTFGAFMMVYRSSDNPFIHPMLSTRRYFRQVGENLGARINQITTSDFNGFEFFFPRDEAERRKIAKIFSLLDERIATQNKIIERLQSLMSGIVEKTFVSTRYAPLQHYAPIITSGKDKDSGGNYPLYGSTGIIGSVSKPSYTKTAVLIARVGSIGNVQYVTIPCGISDNTLIIDAGENNRFIYYYLNDYNFSHITSGTTQPLITASSVKKIAVPIIEKQRKKKIIAMMNSIEHKLCNEKHIASLLSRQKGFLISQMFI